MEPRTRHSAITHTHTHQPCDRCPYKKRRGHSETLRGRPCGERGRDRDKPSHHQEQEDREEPPQRPQSNSDPLTLDFEPVASRCVEE
jgi:hypothetical protein